LLLLQWWCMCRCCGRAMVAVEMVAATKIYAAQMRAAMISTRSVNGVGAAMIPDRNHSPISTEVVINVEEEPNLTKNGPKNDEGVRPKCITKRPSNW